MQGLMLSANFDTCIHWEGCTVFLPWCIVTIINIVIVSTAVRKWFSTPWLSVCFPSGALNPLSAAAAAAAAAGRVALAGQTGSSGVLLVSNLNEEVSNTDTSNTSKMESLRLKLHRSYTPPPFICSCFFCCSLWDSFSISRFVFLSLKMSIKNSCLTRESVNLDHLVYFAFVWTHSFHERCSLRTAGKTRL